MIYPVHGQPCFVWSDHWQLFYYGIKHCSVPIRSYMSACSRHAACPEGLKVVLLVDCSYRMVFRRHVHDFQQQKGKYTDGMCMTFRSRKSTETLMKFARGRNLESCHSVIDTFADPQHAVEPNTDMIHLLCGFTCFR